MREDSEALYEELIGVKRPQEEIAKLDGIQNRLENAISAEALVKELEKTKDFDLSNREKLWMLLAAQNSDLLGSKTSNSKITQQLKEIFDSRDIDMLIYNIKENPAFKETIQFYSFKKICDSVSEDLHPLWLEKLEETLKEGYNPNAEPPTNLDKPHLFNAVDKQSPEIVDLLVKYGADVNQIRTFLIAEDSEGIKTEYQFNREYSQSHNIENEVIEQEKGRSEIFWTYSSEKSPLDIAYEQLTPIADDNCWRIIECLEEHGAKRYNDIKRETIEAKKTKLRESSKRVKDAMGYKDKNGKTETQKIKSHAFLKSNPLAKKSGKGIAD